MTLIVNGEKIEEAAINREVERLRPQYDSAFRHKAAEERQAQLLEWSRENVIEKVLLNQHARQYGRPIPQAEVDSAFGQVLRQSGGLEQLTRELGTDDQKQIKQQIRTHLQVEQMLQELCSDLSEPSEEEVLKYYQQNKEQFKSAQKLHVAHIVKYINWQADEKTAYNVITQARDELKKGALFEMVAAKYSDCPDNGGDIGYIENGQMVEEFEDVVFNLGLNQASDIFRTRFGFHIAKVYDRKPSIIPPLKEVKEQIDEELKEQMRNKTVDEFIDSLKIKAEIGEV